VYTSHKFWYAEEFRLSGTEDIQSWTFAAQWSTVSLQQPSRDVSYFLVRSRLLASMITRIWFLAISSWVFTLKVACIVELGGGSLCMKWNRRLLQYWKNNSGDAGSVRAKQRFSIKGGELWDPITNSVNKLLWRILYFETCVMVNKTWTLKDQKWRSRYCIFTKYIWEKWLPCT
jgi:hypothetical protein